MAAKIPSRYGMSLPVDMLEELSYTSRATNCFVYQKFCRNLQSFLVDYSLTVGSSPILQTDFPSVKFWKTEDYLDEAIQPEGATAESNSLPVEATNTGTTSTEASPQTPIPFNPTVVEVALNPNIPTSNLFNNSGQ